MLKGLTPFTILALTAAAGIAAAGVALFIATSQPWLGIRLSAEPTSGRVQISDVVAGGPAAALTPGTRLMKIGAVAIEADDLVEEPDVAESYVELERFFKRQDALYAAIQGAQVELETRGAETRVLTVSHSIVTPAPRRPVTSLPSVFWIQILTGLVSLMVGFWVWSLRRDEPSTRMLAVAGASIPVAAFSAAVYSSREIALPGGLFHALSATNHFGALAFGVAMVALLFIYPRRLVPIRALWLLPVVFFAIWVMDTGWIGLSGPAEGSHLPTVILMIGILSGAFLQYRNSRHDPAARAAVRWFALSVGLCAGTFVTVVLMPNLFGI